MAALPARFTSAQVATTSAVNGAIYRSQRVNPAVCFIAIFPTSGLGELNAGQRLTRTSSLTNEKILTSAEFMFVL